MNRAFNIVALFAVAVIAVACSSPKTDNLKRLELSLDGVNLTWRGEYDNQTHRMDYTDEWSGCGWWFGDDIIKPAANFDEYDQLVVEVNNVSPDTVPLYLNIRYTTTSVITSETAPIVKGRSKLRLDLDPKHKSHIHEIYVMSKHPCTLTMKSAMLKEATKYGPPHELKSKDGYIEASEFDGYSDEALISFNYYAGGEMTYTAESGNVEPMNNWGIGYVRSNADLVEAKCPGLHIILKKIGEQSFQCLLGDIRYMLELKDPYGERGLRWLVWTGGNLTDVHMINATISEAVY